MWNCPKCRSEVDAGFEVCWSCGTAQDGREDPTFKQMLADDGTAAAVAAPPPPMTAITAEDRFVTIASFFSPGRAHVLRCHLEAEGIPVFLGEDSSFSGANDTKVRVREVDQEKALKILAELPAESTAEDEAKTVELPAPPAPQPVAAPAPAAPVKKAWWLFWLWTEADEAAAQAAQAAKAAPAPAAPAPPAEEPRQVTAWEALRAFESELSNLMDKVATKDWKVNPAFHPEVNAFIQKHSNNSGFVQKARGLQQNRAKYYAKMRELELAPKPPPEPEPVPEATPAAAEASPSAWTPASPSGPAESGQFVATCLKLLRKLVKITLILLVLLVGLVLIASVSYRQYAKKQLEDAISETNKLDPNWQWASLLANRKDVPDDQNAALVVLKVAKLLPEGFDRRLPGGALDRLIPEGIEANQPLPADLLATQRKLLAECKPALEAGRPLEKLVTGRYPDSPAHDPTSISFGTRSNREQMQVSRLCELQAVVAAEDSDAATALASCLMRLNVIRSTGDDPLSPRRGQYELFLVLQRALARTTGAQDEGLAELQKTIQEEIYAPVLPVALRGWRGQWHEKFSRSDWNYTAGIHPLVDELQESVPASQGLVQFLLAGKQTQDRADRLRVLNQGAALADLRVEQLNEAAGTYFNENKDLDAAQELGAMMMTYIADQGHLRCAVTALGVERFRLATGQWPESLDQIVPKYLSGVPVDPFSRMPLRLERFPDGVVVTSSLSGFRFYLYDVAKRRQPVKQ